MPREGKVDLAIYGTDGRLVRKLVAGKHVAGRHTVHRDGMNDVGQGQRGWAKGSDGRSGIKSV